METPSMEQIASVLAEQFEFVKGSKLKCERSKEEDKYLDGLHDGMILFGQWLDKTILKSQE